MVHSAKGGVRSLPAGSLSLERGATLAVEAGCPPTHPALPHIIMNAAGTATPPPLSSVHRCGPGLSPEPGLSRRQLRLQPAGRPGDCKLHQLRTVHQRGHCVGHRWGGGGQHCKGRASQSFELCSDGPACMWTCHACNHCQEAAKSPNTQKAAVHACLAAVTATACSSGNGNATASSSAQASSTVVVRGCRPPHQKALRTSLVCGAPATGPA